MSEIWMPVIAPMGAFPLFTVSDWGRVRKEPHLAYKRADGSWAKECLEPTLVKLRVQQHSKPGLRPQVRARIFTAEREVDALVASLVLRSHEPEMGMPQASVVHFWNGDSTDCRLANLEWQVNVRTANKTTVRILKEEFLEEYAFLRSFGWGHEAIAEKFGLNRAAFEARITSYQCWLPTPAEAEMVVTFNRLVASGEPFIASQVSKRDSAVDALIRMGLKAGRIKVNARKPLFNGDYWFEEYVAA